MSATVRAGSGLLASRMDEPRLPATFSPASSDSFVAAACFASDIHSAYQLEQWLWPFEKFRDSLVAEGEGTAPFGILVRDARVARHIASLTDLPVRFSRKTRGLDDFFSSQSLRVVFYVNQATQNFQSLRFPVPAHVHLSHGESEKISMISNQLKAYDKVFTAGEAARERILSTLLGIDSRALVDVGRPQLDRESSPPLEWQTFAANADGPIAFYAPTWEGDSPSMAYGTIPETGLTLISQLFAAGYRVIFRTHPRSGRVRNDFARAVSAVRDAVEANPQGFVDTTPAVSWQLDAADIAFAEMSSVAFDWLATGKPLIVIAPTDPRAEVIDGGLMDRAVCWRTGRTESVEQLVRSALVRDDRTLARYYLGDTQPGAQIARFVAAGHRVIAERRHALGTSE